MSSEGAALVLRPEPSESSAAASVAGQNRVTCVSAFPVFALFERTGLNTGLSLRLASSGLQLLPLGTRETEQREFAALQGLQGLQGCKAARIARCCKVGIAPSQPTAVAAGSPGRPSVVACSIRMPRPCYAHATHASCPQVRTASSSPPCCMPVAEAAPTYRCTRNSVDAGMMLVGLSAALASSILSSGYTESRKRLWLPPGHNMATTFLPLAHLPTVERSADLRLFRMVHLSSAIPTEVQSGACAPALFKEHSRENGLQPSEVQGKLSALVDSYLRPVLVVDLAWRDVI